MARREAKHLKALYFDLRIKDLIEHYPQANPREAYALIQRFLTTHDFSNEQYSGYHSKHKTTNLEILDESEVRFF